MVLRLMTEDSWRVLAFLVLMQRHFWVLTEVVSATLVILSQPQKNHPFRWIELKHQKKALKYSLLSFLPPNMSHPDLLEGFCRDLEAFSDIFQMEDLHHRPPGCRPIERQHCAVLYDSSTCSEGSWRLNVTDGEQRQLGYFSSDWKYRLVAIYHPARDKLAT